MGVGLRLVPDQLVLSVTKAVKLGQIDDFIDGSFDDLVAVAEQTGPLVVIYHGEVYQGFESPVEVCLPIAAPPERVPDPMVLRTEPEHREAWLTITKGQTDYPEISDQQDVLVRWLEDNHQRISGPFREYYLRDFDDARMDDPVCELAYPVAD